MKRPSSSFLLAIGLLLAGSTALGYYYIFYYEPPLAAAEAFMRAMEEGNAAEIKRLIVVKDAVENLREPEQQDLDSLLAEPFQRGRVVDQRRREGLSRDYYFLTYRQPDGQVYFLVVTTVDGQFRIVIPEKPAPPPNPPYLLEYQSGGQ
jgi:hypothetical protein